MEVRSVVDAPRRSPAVEEEEVEDWTWEAAYMLVSFDMLVISYHGGWCKEALRRGIGDGGRGG